MIPIRDTLQSRRFPVVTVSLIVVNLLVFLYQGYLGSRPATLNDLAPWRDAHLLPPPAYSEQTYRLHFLDGGNPSLYPVSASDQLVARFALIPGELLGGRDLPPTLPFPLWLTLLTSIFLHGGLLHLLGNMLYLWIFGDNVEDAMGPVRFLIFYLACAVAAAGTQIATDPTSSLPMIGASGAIAGVLAAYLMLFPFSRIITLIPIFFFLRLVAVPAVVLLGVWFLLQIVNGLASASGAGGTAWYAHIGGFAAGLVLVFGLRRRAVPVALWQMLRRRRPGV
jgi:membrane associated rhomboid family serine protease